MKLTIQELKDLCEAIEEAGITVDEAIKRIKGWENKLCEGVDNEHY